MTFSKDMLSGMIEAAYAQSVQSFREFLSSCSAGSSCGVVYDM